MLIVQTHFPQGGNKMGKVIIISAALLVLGIIIYKAMKPPKFISKSNSLENESSSNSSIDDKQT